MNISEKGLSEADISFSAEDENGEKEVSPEMAEATAELEENGNALLREIKDFGGDEAIVTAYKDGNPKAKMFVDGLKALGETALMLSTIAATFGVAYLGAEWFDAVKNNPDLIDQQIVSGSLSIVSSIGMVVTSVGNLMLKRPSTAQA